MFLRPEISFISSVLSPQEQAMTLYRRNFLNRYDGMVLGKLWLLVMPCLPIVIYNVLQYLEVFANLVNEVPRSIYLSVGILIYYSFADSLTGGTNLHIDYKNEILKTGFSKAALIQFNILQVLSDLLIRLSCLLIMYQISGYPMSLKIVLIPLMALPCVFLGFGVGLLLGLLAPVYKDIKNIVSIASFYLLFASGVFATIPDTNLFFSILRLSPIYIVVNESRWFLFGIPEFNFEYFATICGISVVVFLLSMAIFRRAERTVNSYL
jgi:ABC-type polysaccharide/polyol phosphate export permease